MRNKLNYDRRLLLAQLDELDREVLLYLSKSNNPLGSWNIQELLDNSGYNTSTSTISRKLRELDDKGYITKVSNKGRCLTDKGKEVSRVIQEEQFRNKLRSNAFEAATVTRIDQLIELLVVRKCLETETARQAALCANDQDLNELNEVLISHKESVMLGYDPTDPALNFHLLIAKISHNYLLSTLMELVIFEERIIEAMFNTLLTRERGHRYILEHEKITAAISSHNPELAAQLMTEHIQTLIDTLDEQFSK